MIRTLERSWLYVPAHDSHKIVRAASADADVVIMDLEDGTPADRKTEARDTVRGAFRDVDFGRSRRYVRINGTATMRWRLDVEATLEERPDGYVLPKASEPTGVAMVAETIREGTENAVPPPSLVPIVSENVRSVLAAEQTMAADPLVETVLWGSEDLSADLGAWSAKDEHGRLLEVFRVVRSLILLHAARHGKRLIDTPHLTIGDLSGLAMESREVARMGFTGKQAIHPEQVPIINEAFVPQEDELRAARKLVKAFDARDSAVIRVDGAMADAPHLVRARRLLALADGLEGPV